MFRSIRWTLQLWHAGILVAALASFGTALYLGVQRAEFKRVDAELLGAARVLAPPPWMKPGRPPGPLREGMWVFGPGQRDGPPDRPDGPERIEGPGPDEQPRGHHREGGDGGDGPRDHERPPPPPERFGPQRFAELSQDLLRRVGQDERDQPYFVIWGQDRKLIRASSVMVNFPADPPAPAPPQGSDLPSPRFRWRGEFREVILPGGFGSTVLVGRSTRHEIEELRNLLWVLLASGTGVLAVGLVGGWLLSQRATRPIQAISRTARAISASDLSRRIDVEETHSELGSLAQTLNDTFARLETAFARQARFTADASHELRTPLSVIHSHTELALAKDRSAPEYRQTLETCLRAARRMKSLVDALLVLARADAGRLELKHERFDLAEAAEECVAMLAPLAQEKHVKLESDLQPAPIEADRTRICQLITNLVSNAIRYNREGGTVKIALRQEGNEAVLSIADTGAGIGPQDQQHVFERFFRADKARSREAGGSGLGLAICQSIVEAHHGTISFTSRPGEGTTFMVRLPVGR